MLIIIMLVARLSHTHTNTLFLKPRSSFTWFGWALPKVSEETVSNAKAVLELNTLSDVQPTKSTDNKQVTSSTVIDDDISNESWCYVNIQNNTRNNSNRQIHHSAELYLLAIFTNFPSKNMPPTQVTGTENHLVLKSTYGKEQNQCQAQDSAE